MTHLEQVLVDSKLFKDIPTEVFLSHVLEYPIITIKPAEVLIAANQLNSNVYLILSGMLSIHLEDQDSPAIGNVGVGEIVGELSLITRTVTGACVIAQTTTQLLVIDELSLWTMIEQIPVMARNLLFILTGWIKSVNKYAINQRKRIDVLQDAVRVDGLTGLYNRRWFDESLQRLLTTHRVYRPLSLIIMDIDYFKQYNDSQGHPGGDQALRALAEVLKAMVRQGDLATRYGGEEFALILPETTLLVGVAVAERIRVAVMNMIIRAPTGQIMPSITLSLGVAESAPDSTPHALIQDADAKLYRAKAEGRNRYCA